MIVKSLQHKKDVRENMGALDLRKTGGERS